MGLRATQVGWGIVAGALAILALRGYPDPRPEVVAAPQMIPVAPVVEPSTTLPDVSPSSTTSVVPTPTTVIRTVWDDLADCTGPGNGRLNWPPGLWDQYRGTAPANPQLATFAQEIAAAQQLVASNGGRYVAWPDCARRLGLPS